MISPPTPTSFRLAYVPGSTPGKWVRIWGEREPAVPLRLVAVEATQAATAVRVGDADAALLRLPVDKSELHAIPLYSEQAVAVSPKEYALAAFEQVSIEDLADELILHPLDDVLGWDQPPGRPALERPASTADAIELVAAGVGLVIVPQSLARLHHRRDLTYRAVVDAPQSHVALAWPAGETSDLMERFIGIVRGRTPNSTRGRPSGPAPSKKPKARKSAEARTINRRGGK